MKSIDLRFGNPVFLFPYWEKLMYSAYNHDLSYKNKGESFLKNIIKSTHKKQRNAVSDYKYIVIGNGASQIIQAIIAVLDKSVYAEPPFFTRFPIFANNVGKLFKTYQSELDDINIITTPNNPDNSINLSSGPTNTIFDLSYNWKQYCEPYNYNRDIMVFSLAKATGHASNRIGWALFQDHELGKKVEQWIENNTCGVSYISQVHTFKILRNQLFSDKTVFDYGKKILKNRWKELNKRKFPFKILNENGMFIWGMGKLPKNIKGLLGSEFGTTDAYFRINIGCSDLDFKRLLKYGKS